MRVLKIVSCVISGLAFGSLVAIMQAAMFYMLFISNEPYPMSFRLRVVVYTILLITSVGLSIEAIIKEIREHNFINEMERLKRSDNND